MWAMLWHSGGVSSAGEDQCELLGKILPLKSSGHYPSPTVQKIVQFSGRGSFEGQTLWADPQEGGTLPVEEK